MRYHLFLLRHGASTGNQNAVRQGRLDYPLAPEGEAQIRHLGEHWHASGLSFDKIITSPLSRARHTAEILADKLGVPLEEDPLWLERHAGQAQGHALDVGQSFYDKDKRLLAYEPLYGDGESLTDLHTRATAALTAVLSRPPGIYLVVAHGGILGAAVRAALGLQPTAWNIPVYIRFDNASFAELILDDHHQTWSLMHVNASAPPRTTAK
ncbi:MAG: histidine phosphatase family protein [Anaerolineales bacterium]|jgi:broad specificity phosphatase PhoE